MCTKMIKKCVHSLGSGKADTETERRSPWSEFRTHLCEREMLWTKLCPSKIHVIKLYPWVWLYLEIGPFSGSLGLNEVTRTELLSRRTDVLKRRGRHARCLSLQLVAPRKGHMRTVRRWPPTGQKERWNQKSILTASWSWTPSLRNFEKIHISSVSCPVCGTLSKSVHPPTRRHGTHLRNEGCELCSSFPWSSRRIMSFM